MLLQQQTGFANFDKLRDLKYQYDHLNNVSQRADLITEVEENFTYDNLDRLKSSTVVSTAAGENLTETKTYDYDTLGNITYKSDVGSYAYDGPRPHAVTSAGGNTYEYDDNGNMISGAGRTLAWSSFNKPTSMVKDGKTVNFTYAPDRARYLKTGSDGAKTLYLDKLYELITKGQEVTHKQFIYAGSSLVAVHVSGLDHNGSAIPVQTRYMHKDNLGSVDTITDGTGTVVDRMSFDPFGSRRQGNWREATVGINLIPILTNRGFTGHEHIDEMDLIHMNGRVYDPTLGRFLSADPHIQSPYSTQSYNRYSYVSNNPLKYTDPSGYFLGGLFKAISSAFKAIGNFVKKYWRQIVSIAIMVYMPHLAFMPQNAVLAGAIAGATAGLVTTGSLKGAVMGGISGAAFGYIGDTFQANSLFSVAGLKKVIAHGIAGGLTGKMQGGKFGQGFLSGVAAQAVSLGTKGLGLFKEGMNGVLKASERVHNAAVAAVIGGTASVLGGGKFMNGAITGAYSRALNDDLHIGLKEKFNKDGTLKEEYGGDAKGLNAGAEGNATVFTGLVGFTTALNVAADGQRNMCTTETYCMMFGLGGFAGIGAGGALGHGDPLSTSNSKGWGFFLLGGKGIAANVSTIFSDSGAGGVKGKANLGYGYGAAAGIQFCEMRTHCVE
ncbi:MULTISPECIES: RHS repeat-associated core domain-containing protein [unclassified Neptuniibacter]|uniref:RHS repeat domain-containing protein n=1 Tax=unclassified Neptuniibacter TaxID=2630693 RepID=UPI000C5EF348|nr:MULTISPECIES: RHS repeat-associated core domain-containing protein [unclassified Neptuniibacter]MAY42505.1 hypothetical protein [Oceanospirillaceae bacterium]